MLQRDTFFIGGQWRQPTGAERSPVISPSTEEQIGYVPVAENNDIDAAVAAASAAFTTGAWPALSPTERGEYLTRLGDILAKRTAEIADITVEEMGVGIGQAPRSLGLVKPVFDLCADLANTYAFERVVRAPDGRAGLVTNEPVGVVAAIIPWNAPVMSAVWKIAPALAAGCTVVLKPPPEAPLSNYILAEAVEEAGLPAGVVNVVPGGREVGDYLVRHPGVDKIAFTGSTAAGKLIMAACADRMTRLVLELGGKSAAIVLDDADFRKAIPAIVHGGMHMSGQVCGAHTRVLIPRSRYAEAVELAAEDARHVSVGDPRDPSTIVGPLVAERQRTRVEGYIQLGVDAGARVVAGGGRPAHLAKGWYVEPTILSDVDNSMRVAREEIFGPVLCLIPYEDEDDAVAIANDSPYGLSGGVWSAEDARALAVAKRIRTGSIAVNGTYPPFPFAPFGGFKESGIGRELGVEGIEPFLEPRSIGLPTSLIGSCS
jgi:acyl-CoA reductase-like NAD-dependent aldehyde dehydrogenase